LNDEFNVQILFFVSLDVVGYFGIRKFVPIAIGIGFILNEIFLILEFLKVSPTGGDLERAKTECQNIKKHIFRTFGLQ
jgi:hypothetical protein